MPTTSMMAAAAFLVAATTALSCRTDTPSGKEAERSRRDSGSTSAGADSARGTLGLYRLNAPPATVLSLPSSLREVSGLAFSPDGRLFAHNDERGTVSEIDPNTGAVVKQFDVGEKRLRDDLEDIAIHGDTMYLVSSGGVLFAFVEGSPGGSVPYVTYRTSLGAANDVEGLCVDPGSGTLLLACKESPGAGLGRVRAVYEFDLRGRTLRPSPRFVIDLGELRKRFALREFMPSGMARHPVSGHFFVISSVGNSVIELSPGGTILANAALPGKYHEQPEGIAFDGRGRLFISNEGRQKGKIAVYRIADE